MARFFSNAKIISVFVVDRLSVTTSRHGYVSVAAVSPSAVSNTRRGSGGGGNVVVTKKGGKESGKTNSWIPDPVTGCYRPENRTGDIGDAAELRRMHLKNKN